MTAVSATTAPTTTSSTGTAASSTPKAQESNKSFSALFAEAKDDLKKGEKLSKVDGHQFARIKGGTRDDMCVNLSGNERSGQAFDLIWRDGRQFHVYGGKGADHKVVEVGKKAAATETTPATDTPATTDKTATTPDKTASTGTTGGTSPTTTPAKTSS
jgi:hypothetical protein